MPYKDYNNKMNEYMQKRYHERRASGIEVLGGKCSSCGTEENLNFDHIDRMTKSFPISKLWSVSWKRYKAELEKCQLLCEPCHKEKTRANRDWLGKRSATIEIDGLG